MGRLSRYTLIATLLAGAPWLAGCTPVSTVAPPALHSPRAEAPLEPDITLTLAAEAPFEETVVLAQRKRIMGRTRSLEQVRRIAEETSEHVRAALRQPAIQGDLRALATAAGTPLEAYRDELARYIEADLLLESGGDPDAVSSASAVGVAQWLAGTAQSHGLRVDLAESRRLTRQMHAIQRELGYLREKPPDWTKPSPSGEAWTAPQWLDHRQAEWRSLREKRRRADERYDPEKAIAAQVRYLVSLTRRYGGIDWALQAYHGGEAGVARTLSLYATGRRSDTFNRSWLASRAGGSGAREDGTAGLSWLDLYQEIAPTSRGAAFSYVYGRSDDHRYYWMKVLMSRRAIETYREDAARFEREWRALRPGNWTEAAWYPAIAEQSFPTYDAVRTAYRDGTLRRLPREASALGLVASHVAPLDGGNAYHHKGLRPEAMELLLRIAKTYRAQGGRAPLLLTAMTQPESYRRAWEARYPKSPAAIEPAFAVPDEPEFQTTGYAFDLRPPADAHDRKVLEYALGFYYDRLYLTWHVERREGYRAYHVVPNPGRREALLGE